LSTPAGAAPDRDSAASLLGFFALTFVLSWGCFIAAHGGLAERPFGAPLTRGQNALILFGTFVPAFVAIALTALRRGEAGLRALLRPLFHWRVPIRYYVFAVGFMAAIKLTGALVDRIVTGTWPVFGKTPIPWLFAAAAVSTVVGGQSGEEIGWRGYALPRLTARLGLGGASILLGVIWAAWHLPLFYLQGADKHGQSFPVWGLQVTAISVAIAWLYWRTGGSLLLTMLMHASINNTKDIVPTVARPPANPLVPTVPLLTGISMVLLWVVAAFLLVRMRRAPRSLAN
jgi:membrane protease YdiL (CAAX protease family)